MRVNVLLVGAVPEPTGGVSVHLQRFIDSSETNNRYLVKCFDMRKKGLFSARGKEGGLLAAVKGFYLSKIVHIHVSNSVVKILVAFLAKLLLKRVVYTHHNSIVKSRLAGDLLDGL